MLIQNIQEQVIREWLAFIYPTERIFFVYLLSSLILAFLSWLYFKGAESEQGPEKIKRGFFGYVFDKDIWFHKSSKQDYLYFIVNAFIYTGIIAQFLISTHFFVLIFHNAFINIFDDTGPMFKTSVLSVSAYTLVAILLMDFAIFITHFAQHKIPVLWEFHKVHHSAEVLNPMTLYRMHPVDLFFTGLVGSMLAGLAFAGFFFLSGEMPQAHEVLGLNIVAFLFYIFGYNLRHSHIWVNYPVWLSNIFVSPAQHQIHHSIDPRHFDKNLGLIFSFWDRLFGTLYIPKKYERLSFGIDKKNPNPFKNVVDMYLQPFMKAWSLLFGQGRDTEKVLFVSLISICLTLSYFGFFTIDRQIIAQNKTLQSVFLEDLTWTEVQKSINQGYDTILIPSGGTEQNGPHVILGKHNYIIRHNAGEIAEKLGRTLVAPVIAYVPEDIHMSWPGTINVPEDVFKKTLQAAAESFIHHGFKNIIFIGDSLGNQAGQKTVAQELSRVWASKDIKVFHADAYYFENGQTDWLLAQGLTVQEIGGHAGIRDTSEIMYINPEGRRKNPVVIEARESGFGGSPGKATRKIGQKMTELKIEAAVKQIAAHLNREINKSQIDTAKLKTLDP